MTSNNEDTIRDKPASYLDIAESFQYNGVNIDKNPTSTYGVGLFLISEFRIPAWPICVIMVLS